MVPRLYSADTTNYSTTAGIGSLVDAISCTVTEAHNSSYELEMEYPLTGAHFAKITRSRIILARPNAIDYPQPFRIYDISKPIAGIVTVHAQHVAYDLEGIPVKPFTATTATEALTALKSGSIVANNFTFRTDVTTINSYTLEAPKNAWEVLADIVSYYGGDLHFNGWNVELLKSRGSDKHAVLSYGKNLTDLTQDENIADTYTGCIAYWISSDKSTSVYSDVQYAADHASFAAEKIYMLDCSSDFTAAPTASDLNTKAAAYVTANGLGVPKTTITVSYVDLANATEYDMADGDAIGMCDTITVSYDALGVSAKPKVLQTKWDVLMDRYAAIQLGNTNTAVKKDLADVIAETSKTATQAATTTTAIENSINSGCGGGSSTSTDDWVDWNTGELGYGIDINLTKKQDPTSTDTPCIMHIHWQTYEFSILAGNDTTYDEFYFWSYVGLDNDNFMPSVSVCVLEVPKGNSSDLYSGVSDARNKIQYIIPSIKYEKDPYGSSGMVYAVGARIKLTEDAKTQQNFLLGFMITYTHYKV